MEVNGGKRHAVPLVRPQKNLETQNDRAREGGNWSEQSQI